MLCACRERLPIVALKLVRILGRTKYRQWNASKSNYGIELNWSQSVDWVRLSSAIERIKHLQCSFVRVRLPNKSKPIELIPLHCDRPRSVNKFVWTKIMLCGLKNTIRCLYRIDKPQKHRAAFNGVRWINSFGQRSWYAVSKRRKTRLSVYIASKKSYKNQHQFQK